MNTGFAHPAFLFRSIHHLIQSVLPQLSFSFCRHQPLHADFSGGQITSDAGLLPLRSFDERHHLTSHWAAACSVAFEAEAEEENVMRRRPRDPQLPLFDHRTLLLSFLQGASVLVIALAVFVIAHLRGEPETNTRALTFTTFIIANLALILANRSWTRPIVATLRSPNPALWWVIGGALAILAIVLYVPLARDLFRFSRLHNVDLVICGAAGVFSVMWFEALKVFGRSRIVTAS